MATGRYAKSDRERIQAFKIMKRMPAVERAEILYKAAQLLHEKKEEFAEINHI